MSKPSKDSILTVEGPKHDRNRSTRFSVSDDQQESVGPKPGETPAHAARRRRMSLPYGRRDLAAARKAPPVDRKKLARDRFRRAILKVKVMIRFGFPMRPMDEDEGPSKPVFYENSYRTEPSEGLKFRSDLASKVLTELLEDNLHGYKYSKNTAPNYCRALSTMAMDKMKAFKLPGYKYVCNVIILEQARQGFDLCSRCIWNAETDNSATATLKCEACIAIATVHASYTD